MAAARAGAGEEEAVEPGNMVGGDQHRPCAGNVLSPNDLQAVERKEHDSNEALNPPPQREQEAGGHEQEQHHDAENRQQGVHAASSASPGERLSGRMAGQTSSKNTPVSKNAGR